MRPSRTHLLPALLASAVFTAATPAQSTATPDLRKQPTLYAVGYAHLDTEWRWEYPQVIDEYLRKTMTDNFKLIEKYPHYTFNFSGANRYRLMQEYYPADFARMKGYIAQGRWFPAGSSMEEGDVNAPSAEAIIRQVLYGNEWFRHEFGKASEEYMLPDCFGFPSSLPTILAHSGVRGFSTQKLTWGSSAYAGGPDSIEKTPVGTPFDVGVWVGPDGESVLSAFNPGPYGGRITTDLSTPLPALPPNAALADVDKKMSALEGKLAAARNGQTVDQNDVRQYMALRNEQSALTQAQAERTEERYQGDWASRVMTNGQKTGLFADYHYYGTGDIGGAPDEESVKRLEAIITKGKVDMPPENSFYFQGQKHPDWPAVQVGEGPVQVVSATADQMFRDIHPDEAAKLPRYTGELELTNHSAGSLTSQAYQKRWIRQEELLADAAEKSSVAATWLGARTYPQQRLNAAWTLAMGAHFHDLAAGTATPRSYEFAWNDDAIAMNQFADVLKSATSAVAAGLDTDGKGIPVVVYNPLNIQRADLVQAKLNLGAGMPGAGMPTEVRVTGPDGKAVPAQISGDKVVFEASVPSVGFAVYHVEPGTGGGHESASELRVTDNELENAFYRVRLNADGDVASIFDKTANRELLSAPARLALSYDNPQQWPAWNMDWEQEQAAPKEFVSGPVKMRVVERGPVRASIEVTRETAGSRFVQTIRLAAGDAGKHVEFGNVIDWTTRERNLKATFPLTASNGKATYNWDIGTIERTSAEPKKFEVPSHQWIDLTDASGEFGTTILTDDKNGSDKPDDHTLRLTLIRTPGVAGGYPDQATQDIGHHEFTYGLAGHVNGWREAQSDWQGERLNAPLLAFETVKHGGSLGRTFSLVKVSSPRIRILALKKAEESDEVLVRLVEMDGRPQSGVHVAFAAPVVAAREVNGQEQARGTASVTDGALVTSFGAYQPRAFALKFAPAKSTVAGVESVPVPLAYDLATATNDGEHATAGFDGKGDAYPAEMLPTELTFNDVKFQLAPAKTGTPNAVVAKGQAIQLPSGGYNRVYLLAASTGGDQRAAFQAGSTTSELNVEDWGGFIGQWDDRQWSSVDRLHDNYGEMTALKPGFLKRADLVWYASHHHDAAGANVAYSYSYLFGYSMDLAKGTKTLVLPNNDKIRILAISVAKGNPEATPAQPLYDVLPSPNAGTPDFTLSGVPAVSVSQGKSRTSSMLVLPRGSFADPVNLTTAGLPPGVTATFNPASTTGASVMTLTATSTALPAQNAITITGTSGAITHTAAMNLAVTPVLKGTVPVDLTPAYNVSAIYNDGSKFEADKGADSGGYAFSEQTLGREQVGADVPFRLGPPNAPDAVTGKTITLPPGKYASVKILATAVEGNQRRQIFTVNYRDGSAMPFTRSLSDWASSGDLPNESAAVQVPYRLVADGSTDANPFNLNAYTLELDPAKEVRSLTLPTNQHVMVFGVTLVPTR